MIASFKNKIKEQVAKSRTKISSLKKGTKIALGIGVIAICLALVFTAISASKNKYAVLFSELDVQDAADISAELESKKIDTKVKGSTIYVPRTEVDKLRLELAPSLTSGSKGFALMDDSSSIGLTDEEFQIKKQRMIQGEIEKTIKSFPQVEDTRVHITFGESSVFEKEAVPGSAAVYLMLKPGTTLEKNQIKSVMALISGSVTNIPEKNVQVIDNKMNLLSEGILEDENVNENNQPINSGISVDKNRASEQALNKQLEKSILEILEPIFGKGKVKATVNADLSFDTAEKTEIKIDPDKVAIKETRSKNSSKSATNNVQGVDANMNNQGNNNGTNTEDSLDESFEYETGKIETHTIVAPGELNRLTASVAIDGKIAKGVQADVEDIVNNAIGMDGARGDTLSVVSMVFDPEGKKEAKQELEEIKKEGFKKNIIKAVIGVVAVVAIGAIGYLIYKKRSEREDMDYEDEDYISKSDSVDRKDNPLLGDDPELTLEEAVKMYAEEKPDQVTEIIKTWLNE